jgi:hypothetical protein
LIAPEKPLEIGYKTESEWDDSIVKPIALIEAPSTPSSTSARMSGEEKRGGKPTTNGGNNSNSIDDGNDDDDIIDLSVDESLSLSFNDNDNALINKTEDISNGALVTVDTSTTLTEMPPPVHHQPRTCSMLSNINICCGCGLL